MKRAHLIALASVLLLVLSGCASPEQAAESSDSETSGAADGIACEFPYIRMGAGCCLDDNSNSICDTDEVEEAPEEPVQALEPEPEDEKPEKVVLPIECSLQKGWECLKVAWDNNDFRITIRNKDAVDVEGVAVTLDGIGCYTVDAEEGPSELYDGDNGTYSSFAGCNPKVGEYEFRLSVDYTEADTGAKEKSAGTLSVLVKEIVK